MEAEPQIFHAGAASPHSRTLTPTTAARPRPKPPLTLSTRSRSIEHPSGSDTTTTTTDGGGVDGLAGTLSELGRTDFVRKYSRKSRHVRSYVDSPAATAASPTVDLDVRSAASSPVVSAASRYQHLRSPVMHASAGSDATAMKEDCVSGGVDVKAMNYHDIPTQRDDGVQTTGAEQRLVDQSRICGVSGSRPDVVETSLGERERSHAQLDAKSTDADDAKRSSSSRTSTTSPRAGTGLFRSESDASKMRSFTLRSLRPKTITTVGQLPPQPQTVAHAASRGGTTPLVGKRITSVANSVEPTDRSGMETDDEGVGAVDLDEPCFKDTYISVTKTGSDGANSNRGALLPNLQQYRDTHLLPGDSMGHHPRLAEHTRPVAEMSGTTGGVATTQKTNSGGRFLTHPPLRERSVTREPGSVDSNGLGALRDVSDPTKQILCLASQISVSSADSHICPSEVSTSLSYLGGEGVVEPVTGDTDELVRKNSKTQKYKSRSDPTRSEKYGESTVVDIPSIVSGTMHTQSSPVLLDEDDELRHRRQSSITHFPFTADSASASASDLSDRSGVGAGCNVGSTTYNHVLKAGADDNSAKSSPSTSMQDVVVRVVLKSDDSFEELPPTSIKPPRPKATKKRPRAPPSPLTTPAAVSAGDTSSSASSLVRKVFSKDRSSGSFVGGKLQVKDGGSDLELTASAAASTSSLTIPFSKKSSLLRSHSSAGNEAGGSGGSGGGSVTSGRPKHCELPQSLVIGRQRSPGAPDTADVVNIPSRNGGVTASASVPELCDASSGAKNHNSLTASYTPSLEPVLSSSTFSLFDGPAGNKVGFSYKN